MLSRLEGARAATFTNPIDQKDYIQRETGSIHDFINGLEDNFLPHLVGAEVPTTTGAIPQLLQRLAGSLVKNCTLLVRSVPEFNYASGVLTPSLIRLFAAAGCADLLSGFPNNFCVIFLSSFTPNSVLTHTLVAHELGHILYDVYDLDSTLTPDSSAFEAELKTLVAGDPIREAQIKQKLADWQMEFTCDLLGLSLLGPAYVYALTGFLTATGGSSSLDAVTSHPSPRMRITLMLDTIEGKYGPPVFDQDSMPLMHHLRGYLESTPTNPTEPSDDLAFKFLNENFSKTLLESRKIVGTHAYTPENYLRDIAGLRSRLENTIPPNEYEDGTGPATFASILNASWDFYLGESKLMPGSNVTLSEAKEQFYGLVSWALEAAELSEAWKSIDPGC